MFEEVAELLFWDEFTSRFNFVAVDYLVYTNEVIGNISAPTKYYSVEGPNLYFAMKKDGVPVDPFEYLE